MEKSSDNKTERRLSFTQRLAADPDLVRRSDEIAHAIRNAARKDIEAGERSERLTKEDFAVYINARADITLSRDE